MANSRTWNFKIIVNKSSHGTPRFKTLNQNIPFKLKPVTCLCVFEAIFRFLIRALTSIVLSLLNSLVKLRLICAGVFFVFVMCLKLSLVFTARVFFFSLFLCDFLLFDYGVHSSIKFFLVFFCLNLPTGVWFITLLHECIEFTFALIKFGLPCTAIIFVCSNVST